MQIPIPIPTPIPDSLLRAVYASDQAMYPVALSYDRLRGWVDASPDLSVCFTSPRRDSSGPGAAATVAGVVVVLPLRRRHWEDLLVGRLREAEIDARSMFPRAKDGQGPGEGEGEGEEVVGLHVYHVERFDAAWAGFVVNEKGVGEKGFTEYALREVMRRVEGRMRWKVIGLSALTATPAGKRTFERLGFTPTGYRELFVVNGLDEGSADASAGDKRQTETVCLHPGDKTTPEMVAGGDATVSISEMTVKYSGPSNLAGSGCHD